MALKVSSANKSDSKYKVGFFFVATHLRCSLKRAEKTVACCKKAFYFNLWVN